MTSSVSYCPKLARPGSSRQTPSRAVHPAACVLAACLAGAPAASQVSDEPSVAERRAALEVEIRQARQRRHEILERILEAGGTQHPEVPAVEDPSEGLPPGRVDWHRPSPAPEIPEIENELFDHGIEGGPWPWTDHMVLIAWTLDADRDGRPEEVRLVDPDTGALLRRRADTDGDGQPDSWSTFRDGALVRRDRDMDGDGTIDVSERYEGGYVAQRDVDRDQDGTIDARSLFRDGWLAEERFDPDNDGVVDLVTFYQEGRIHERHHDVDGDGRIDVRSIYRDGRLTRRLIVRPDAPGLEVIERLPGP